VTNKFDTRELIFKGHGIVGRLFTSNPFLVAGAASGLAILFLNLTAGLLGLGHILDQNGKDVGYYAKYNWSLVYPILAPLLISLGIFAFRQMRDAVYELIEDSPRRAPVIVDEAGNVAENYPLFLSDALAAGAGWIECLAGVAAVAITLVDTADLWPGFINSGTFSPSRVPEWDTAFRIHGSQMFGKTGANFVFDLVAYTFQTALIFLGLFFLMKYWMFLKTMTQIIDRDRPPFRFKPLVCDLERRLGLKPLGWVFNLFLAVVVLFQAFAFYHRIELIDGYQNNPPNTYFKNIWGEVRRHKDEGTVPQVRALLKLPVSTYAWSHLANPSSWLPLVFSVPPIIVVCLLPLGRLFWYLRREVKLQTELTNAELARAKTDKDKKRADEMEKEYKCLRETTIWPNGNVAGASFLILMVALAIGTACPPLLVWGLASGFLVKKIWSYFGKSPKSSE